MTCQEKILQKIVIQFNDPNLVFAMPPRAIYFSSYKSLNPNDMTRILIKRTFDFMLKLWKNCSPKYNMERLGKDIGGNSF